MRRTLLTSGRAAVAAVSCFTLWSPAANAETLLATTMFLKHSGPVLDLADAPAVQSTLSFTTVTPGTRVVIMFNAECAVAGMPDKWVSVDILVDGTPIAPSYDDNAFCSGNATAGFDGWASQATIATAVLANAGVHRVQVRTSGNAPPASRWIDDLSLIVLH
jgi:hypothetical protein